MTGKKNGKRPIATVRNATVSTGWELMPADAFPSFYTEWLTLRDEHEQIVCRIGFAVGGTALYLFTNMRHPDNESRDAIYRALMIEGARDAIQAIMGIDIGDKGQVVTASKGDPGVHGRASRRGA